MSGLRNDARSVSRLLGDAFEQLSQLIQTEVRLAGAELSEKARGAAIGIALLFGGMLLTMPALVLLLFAVAFFLVDQGMSPVMAHFLAGLVGIVAGVIFIFAGISRLKPASLKPETTIQQVQKDIAVAKEMAQ